GTWGEPDEAEAGDTLPARPPQLDLLVLPDIAKAVEDAARLSAAGHHESAYDDARRAFLLLGSELGLEELVLADMLGGERMPRRREVGSFSWQQANRGEHFALVRELAGNKQFRVIPSIRRVLDGPGWSFHENAGGDTQVFRHSREACDAIERLLK